MSALASTRRRSIIAALAGAALFPAAAAPAAAPTVLSPEFRQLGEKVDALRLAFKNASERYADAYATYQRLRPSAPRDLIVSDGLDRRAERQANVDGRALMVELTPGDRRVLYMYQSHLLLADIVGRQISGRTKEGRRLHRLVRLARAYEKAERHALDQSAARQRRSDLFQVESDADCLADDASKVTPTTMAELLILARLVKLKHDIDRATMTTTGHSPSIEETLVECLIGISGRTSA